ncbi:NAD(P)H-dependent oxidoreductase [Streptomyces sp. TS71-3]|uniref:NAD(P)H-dependent oxidoreductase n=1 Tax=Streptomyces sp. TS71-3 TaxID=2733862 RepID=UPI001B1DAEA4|nr:NAD(P)H-dependent oxidoreductase [Streptomyces sp. TS71-3]GHJ42621.1 NAD(P)H dehydrogenase (quinone) [Streptomyces sp. TS71-3]
MTEATPRKNVLLVSVHPEPRSLNAALTAFAAGELRAAGHQVQVSDLYAMKWKAAVDADDFSGHAPDRRLDVLAAQSAATLSGRLAPDIAAEQEKLLWSDAVILQFPMWWFSVPALLKGWIDRVFTFGFAHGPTLPPPYSEGTLAGRRALVSMTAGARGTAFSDRGIHGRLQDLLHPLQHGLFWFTGMAPLQPFVLYETADMSGERFAAAKEAYRARLQGLFTDEPVPFRRLDGGDYGHDMRLRAGAETPGAAGSDLHHRPRD